MNHVPWLTLIIVVPLGTALLVGLTPRERPQVTKLVTVAGALVTAGLVAGVLFAFDRQPRPGPLTPTQTGLRPGPLSFQFAEHVDWIGAIGAAYRLGLDGVSAWLLALNAGVFLLGAVVVVSVRSTERLRFYCGLLLLTEAATAGVLLATDLLLFYLFWEGMLIPLYFLLSNYGDRNRGRATLKFVLYTVAGSLLMLVSIIYLYFHQTPVPGAQHGTFDIETLILNPGPAESVVHIPTHYLGIPDIPLFTPQDLAFLGFAIAFAIKIPLVPFHTWLPDAYTSAPPQVLVFFAGIVSKLGAFGFIRYGLTLFSQPVRHFQWLLAALAIVSILYGAIMALAESDIKRIVAYASISHLGFIALGIFALNGNGINGAVIQMINHGIIIAALFLVVGMVEARLGTRERAEIGGLERYMPWLYAFFLVITLAGLGMPGTNSFVGEFTVLLGAFQAAWILAVLASVGVILACWYMLRLHQGLMHGPVQSAGERIADISLGERLVLAPLTALMLIIGVFPQPIGNVARSDVARYVAVAATSEASPTASTVHP